MNMSSVKWDEIELIPVVINDEGDVFLHDEFELVGHQWFMEGNFSTAKIPDIEPTKEEFEKWARLPDSANGDMGIYLSYWEAII